MIALVFTGADLLHKRLTWDFTMSGNVESCVPSRIRLTCYRNLIVAHVGRSVIHRFGHFPVGNSCIIRTRHCSLASLMTMTGHRPFWDETAYPAACTTKRESRGALVAQRAPTSIVSATPARAAAGVALHAGAVAHQRVVAAFAAGITLKPLHLGLGAGVDGHGGGAHHIG
jgi:hypothetical protein